MNKDSEKQKLEEAIIRVIVFFDMFDYPLTEFEIWKYLDLKCDLSDIKSIITRSIEQKNGFYFLRGRNEIIEKRMKRYNLNDKKFNRALLIAWIFKFIPWIKMIAVTGSKGSHNLKKEGDIDFFIVTQKKRIWVTRFFCIGVVKMLNLRPKKKSKKNKICLSFYITEDEMSLENVMLSGVDVDFIYWLAGFVPIYERDNIYGKFCRENDWIEKYLPNFFWTKTNKRNVGKSFGSFYYNSVDVVIGGAERILRKIQLKILPGSLKSLMNKDTRVIINDKILKLHSRDKREECRKRFETKMKDLRHE